MNRLRMWWKICTCNLVSSLDCGHSLPYFRTLLQYGTCKSYCVKLYNSKICTLNCTYMQNYINITHFYLDIFIWIHIVFFFLFLWQLIFMLFSNIVDKQMYQLQLYTCAKYFFELSFYHSVLFSTFFIGTNLIIT